MHLWEIVISSFFQDIIHQFSTLQGVFLTHFGLFRHHEIADRRLALLSQQVLVGFRRRLFGPLTSPKPQKHILRIMVLT